MVLLELDGFSPARVSSVDHKFFIVMLGNAMQCPKCNQPLSGIDYQGVHIETCPACGGDWLDAGELGNIVEAREARFSEQECLAIAQAATIAGVWGRI